MEACSHHSCSYGINYDRLSVINELIPIICRACTCTYTCVRTHAVCMHSYVFVIYQHGHILSIHKSSFHHHLSLTFLITIDLFARHKYLWWNPLSQDYTQTHTHTWEPQICLLICLMKQRCGASELCYRAASFFFSPCPSVIVASRGQQKSKWKRSCWRRRGRIQPKTACSDL